MKESKRKELLKRLHTYSHTYEPTDEKIPPYKPTLLIQKRVKRINNIIKKELKNK